MMNANIINMYIYIPIVIIAIPGLFITLYIWALR
jgi:hypothetical protein